MTKCFDLLNARSHRLMLAGALVLGWNLVAQSASVSTPRPPAPRRPNIILILADDLGYGDLGCYGSAQVKTPNLDQMAAEGIRFRSFYAGSTVCAPSRATFMLGQHTGHVNIRGNKAGLALQPGDVTVARLLRDAGYHTALIGKWGLGDEASTGTPDAQGFEEFVGFLNQTHAHDYYPERLWRTDPRLKVNQWQSFPENQGGKQGLYIPDLFTTAALNYLRISKPNRINRYQPFFLFLSYTLPHANNEEGKRSGNGMQVPSDAPYAAQPWPQPEKNKAAMITRMDADIGRILAKLKELKIEDNTVVFFTSDNGPHKEGGVDPKILNSSGPLRGIKRDLTEGGIRVPMIVRWPGRIQPGQVSDFVWAAWDFLPTAAEIGRVTPPKGLDGFSVLPLLTGRTQTNRHESLYWEFHERGFQQAARMADWKAIRPQAGEPLELYELKTDLAEKQNVAEKHPEVVKQLEQLMKAARTESSLWPIQKPQSKDEVKVEGAAKE